MIETTTEHPVEHYLKFITEARTAMGWQQRMPDFAYNSYEALILDRGKVYQGAPRPKGFRKRANKMCFRNEG